MLIHTPKKVRPTVHIKHHPLPLVSSLFSFGVIAPHLDPFGLQYATVPAPLPPFISSNLVNPMMSQLGGESIRRLRNWFFWYSNLIYLNPPRVRHPLRGKTLNIFNSVERGIAEELADE